MGTSGKAAVWRQRLQRFDRARQTVAEFCRDEGVSAPSFYQWRKRLAPASKELPAKRGNVGRKRIAPAFQQVLVSGGSVVTIALPSGVRLELPAQQLPLVRAVLADLLQAEAGRLGDA